MDTNNNSSEQNEMEIQEEQHQQQQAAISVKTEVNDQQQATPNTQQTTIQQQQQQENIDSKERIELYVKYDASDTLGHESGTQTPIEDEPQAADHNDDAPNTTSSTTTTITNKQSTAEDNSSTTNNESKHNRPKVVCVQESEEENSESIEIELEDDNSLLLTSLQSLFPDATGLKYRHSETNTLRGVKLANDGKFVEPADGWSSVKSYICVFNRGFKRKNEDEDDNNKKPRNEVERPTDSGSDLVVLGLPWTTTEETMKSYFEQYGEVVMVQVKTDKSGKSRGFGFVRFAKSSIQNKLLSMRHFIDGRWCDVRVPMSKAEAETAKAVSLSRKIFVGHLSDNITTDDLRNYFSEYGTLTDVFIPQPFRKFAFVTFGTADMAQSIFKHKHVIKGTPVSISEAIPRDNAPSNFGGGRYNAGSQGNAGSYNAVYATPANNNIHPFNTNYPAGHHYYGGGKNNAGGNFGGANAPQTNRKMHPQSTYYQMPSYGTSGPSSSVDSTSYVNHSAHGDFGGFGGAPSSYNQASSGVNGGQYYKMQQQPIMAPNQNHSTYPNQSSYSSHGSNFPRSSYGSVWK